MSDSEDFWVPQNSVKSNKSNSQDEHESVDVAGMYSYFSLSNSNDTYQQ